MASDEPANQTEPLTLANHPVAFRVRLAGVRLNNRETWTITGDEEEAKRLADACGTEYQALYIRDGTPMAVEKGEHPLSDVAKSDIDTIVANAVAAERERIIGRIALLAKKWANPNGTCCEQAAQNAFNRAVLAVSTTPILGA